MLPIHEHSSIEHHTSTTTALDHWDFEHYYIWLESISISAEHKIRNRRHSALDLCGFLGA
ncbi:MAG: hypothetical protein FWE28_05390 [Oscillospiraceae bacterium]|nr:hypothetical protein [Oscillospiraceae bacterium]